MHMTRHCRMGVAVLVGTLLTGCMSVTGQSTRDHSSEAPGIGWMHGSCIALADADVASGAGVMLVMLEEPQRVVHARIGQSAGPGDACPALAADRHDVNVANGLSFYFIEPEVPDALAIGILAGEPAQAPDAVLDIDQDGRRDAFSHCATSEGVLFRIRSGASAGQRLWTGYYYLGYDVEADCREND